MKIVVYKKHFVYLQLKNINIMESLFTAFHQQLRLTDSTFTRYLHSEIDWKNRLIAITGPRGAGKSTLILQHIKKTFGNSPKNVLYASLDHIYFTTHRLFELGMEFEKQGGEYFFLDEVHKYADWSKEIKNLYDSFPNLKIVFTGSSMLEVYKGNADLSRRAIHYLLHGMSFREFLILEKKLDLPAVSLEYLLSNHIEISQEINERIKPLPLFEDYLKFGYYPYYKENKNLYQIKLLNVINVILEMDLPAVEKIELHSIRNIRKLLSIMAQMVPFTPNITDLSAKIGTSRNSLLSYLSILEKAQLLNLLSQDVSGLRGLSKPEKIYLHNTNLIHALDESKPDTGNLRETFFFNQLKVVASVMSSPKTDFCINNTFQFEIGGKNKGHEQITGLDKSYLALDNIESGFGNKIPLWLFGFLY